MGQSFIQYVYVLMNLDVKIDEGFKDFYMWAKENDIPVIIVSR